MEQSAERVSETKITTQNAPLEKLLRRLRIAQIRPYVQGKNVLDFGCGEDAVTLRHLKALCQNRVGVDIRYRGLPAQHPEEGLFLAGDFQQLRQIQEEHKFRVETVISLATFEHLWEHELLEVLHSIRTDTDAQRIVGTAPTRMAKPVLEFLSYRLHLIDESQIRDHKVYYTASHLTQVVNDGGWRMQTYRTFQFGFNSFFILERR